MRVPRLEAAGAAARAERAAAMRASAGFEHYALSESGPVAAKEARMLAHAGLQSCAMSSGLQPHVPRLQPYGSRLQPYGSRLQPYGSRRGWRRGGGSSARPTLPR